MSASYHSTPPKMPLRFLRWFCSPELIEDVEGDLSELFAIRHAKSNWKARLLFVMDVLLLFRPGIIRKIEFIKGQNNKAMFGNFLKIAFRNALRHKGYTALNLLGLIVGIASSMLVLLWIEDERSMDKFHEKGDEIYRAFRNMRQSNGIVSTTSSMPKPLADLVSEEYSEVDEVALMSWEMDIVLKVGDKRHEEMGRFATPEFLQMFTFPLLVGDQNTALDELNSIVISESVARKFFGDAWETEAMGKILEIEGQDVAIAGVFEDIGTNSSLEFDWLINAQTFFNLNRWVDNWGNGSFSMFMTIADEEKAARVSEKILMEIMDHTADNDMAGDEQVIIYKFEDTYLNSNFENGVISGGRIDYVRIMTVVAIFVLMVACINFMNLTTARSSRRSKEIGLRKVMGAARQSISTQFFFEALFLTAIAMAISVLIVALLLPYFNQLVDKSLFIDFSALKTWYFVGGLTLIVGLLSGSYPAILLSGFNIVQSIKGGIKQSTFATVFRKGLVVFQFAISTLLIIGTVVIYKQIDYILTKDVGMDKDNLVAIQLQGDLAERLDTYKSELLRMPEVKSVTGTTGNPLRYGRSTSSASWEGKDPSAGYEVNVMLTDEDFITTTGMEILKGRDFSYELEDSANYIINEVAAELMGFEDPIGKNLSFWGMRGKVIGVVKNFHMANMYEPIAPLIITCAEVMNSELILTRIEGDKGEVLQQIEALTANINPGFDFSYTFIDDAYEDGYRSEKTVGTLANIFAILSILISSLGLLGLTSYSAEQRSREIGVRKVHGASVMSILMLLSKDYSRLIIISFVIAIPLGYMVTQNWLDGFEFRTSLGPLVFIVASLVAFAIGMLTVGTKSYQAATANPVKSLRSE